MEQAHPGRSLTDTVDTTITDNTDSVLDDKHAPKAARKRLKKVLRRTRSGRLVQDVSLTELQRCFHLPEATASKQLGVGLTVFKRICRTYSITRWPFRKMQRLFLALRRIEDNKEHSTDRESVEQIVTEFYTSLPLSSWHTLMVWLLRSAQGRPQQVPLKESIEAVVAANALQVDLSEQHRLFQPSPPPGFGQLHQIVEAVGMQQDEEEEEEEDEDHGSNSSDMQPAATHSNATNKRKGGRRTSAEYTQQQGYPTTTSPFVAFSVPFEATSAMAPPPVQWTAQQALIEQVLGSLRAASMPTRPPLPPSMVGQHANSLPAGILPPDVAAAAAAAMGAEWRSTSLPPSSITHGWGVLPMPQVMPQVMPQGGLPMPQGVRYPSLPTDVNAIGTRLNLGYPSASPLLSTSPRSSKRSVSGSSQQGSWTACTTAPQQPHQMLATLMSAAPLQSASLPMQSPSTINSDVASALLTVLQQSKMQQDQRQQSTLSDMLMLACNSSVPISRGATHEQQQLADVLALLQQVQSSQPPPSQG